MPTAALRLCDHPAIGPTGVLDQSMARVSSAISPAPARKEGPTLDSVHTMNTPPAIGRRGYCESEGTIVANDLAAITLTRVKKSKSETREPCNRFPRSRGRRAPNFFAHRSRGHVAGAKKEETVDLTRTQASIGQLIQLAHCRCRASRDAALPPDCGHDRARPRLALSPSSIVARQPLCRGAESRRLLRAAAAFSQTSIRHATARLAILIKIMSATYEVLDAVAALATGPGQ